MEAGVFSFFQKWQSQDAEADEARPEGLLSSVRFEEQLLLERARADRAGASFSLLTFRIDALQAPDANAVAERVLAHVLVKQSRVIDTKGFYRESLALIMPYTPSAKAEVVWAKIQDSYKRRVVAELGGRLPAPEVQCEVYAYPNSERTRQFG